MKCLNYSETTDLFIQYIDQEVKAPYWQIRYGTAKERAKRCEKKDYFSDLKKAFNSFVQAHSDDGQVISWLDSLTLMRRVAIKLREYDLQYIDYITEYVIPFANSKRPDYILSFKNTVLLIEFGRNTDYNAKLSQAIQYQVLLENLFQRSIKVIPYVFIYNIEFDEKMEEKVSFIEKNNTIVLELALLIKRLYETDTTAIEELFKLDYERL